MVGRVLAERVAIDPHRLADQAPHRGAELRVRRIDVNAVRALHLVGLFVAVKTGGRRQLQDVSVLSAAGRIAEAAGDETPFDGLRRDVGLETGGLRDTDGGPAEWHPHQPHAYARHHLAWCTHRHRRSIVRMFITIGA